MTKRPIGVWLICAYFALIYLSSLLSIGYAFLSDNPDVQWGRAYYLSLGIWELGFLLLNWIVALSAAYALFTLRRMAAWLFSAVLVLGIANAVRQLSSGWVGHEGTDMIGSQGALILLAFGFAITASIVAYVWWLRMRQVLK